MHITHVQKCNSKIGHISLSLRRPSEIESSSSKMAGKLMICRRASASKGARIIICQYLTVIIVLVALSMDSNHACDMLYSLL